MPARARPRARSGRVQNKYEGKKLAWLKNPTAELLTKESSHLYKLVTFTTILSFIQTEE